MKSIQQKINRALEANFSGFYTPEFLHTLSQIYGYTIYGSKDSYYTWYQELLKAIDSAEHHELAIFIPDSDMSPMLRSNRDWVRFNAGDDVNYNDVWAAMPAVLWMGGEDELETKIDYYRCTIGFKQKDGVSFGNVRFNKFGEMVGVSAHDGMDSYTVPAYGMNIYPKSLYRCTVRVLQYVNKSTGKVEYRHFQVTDYQIVKMTVKSFIEDITVLDNDYCFADYQRIVVQAGNKRLYYDPVLGKTDGSRTIEGLCRGIANLTPNFNKSRVINRVKELHNEIARNREA